MPPLHFTVIVPNYRGGEYLKKCVRSILSQRYEDFELAVLDNCSQDGSVEWLESLDDERIMIYPSSVPLSMEENWARALQIPKNKYMTFFGHDDLMDENYLEVMSMLITRESEASLYFAHFRYIDDKDNVTRVARPLPERETADEYLAGLFTEQRDTYGSGYVFRSETYHQIGGMPQHKKLLFADDALWIMLMRKSYKATAREECFSVRVHPQSTGAAADWQLWSGGMKEYVPFLASIAVKDEKFADALYQYGPGYFLNWCDRLYARALVVATKHHEPISPEVKPNLIETLIEIAPSLNMGQEVIDSFRNNRNFRFREWINSNLLGRMAYNLYILTRYQEWREQPVFRKRK